MKTININCPCKRVKCERHGNCSQCREHHTDNPKKGVVYCEREVKEDTSKRLKAHRQESKNQRD